MQSRGSESEKMQRRYTRNKPVVVVVFLESSVIVICGLRARF